MRIAVLLALALSSPALAWEPNGVASVDARLSELREAWQGKDPGAVLQDKIKRARQKQRPAWVDHKAWYIEEKNRRLYFGVGASSNDICPGRGPSICSSSTHLACLPEHRPAASCT